MHMPGHKRNEALLPERNPYAMDITEIDGFDNLHEAEEIIKESMELAAKLYQSEQTYYLINGSTVGLLAGIMGSCQKGDQVLVARNCHKAVYNALYLQELQPVYLYPEFNATYGFYGQISPESVREALTKKKDIRLVILTSPTYEGIVSDIRGIATVCHEAGIPLLVDEAHGAHLGFHPFFPRSAVQNGADIVIQSTHKTMPAFTQTALLHVNGSLAKKDAIAQYLQMLQSSSPSYLLLGSIDRCMALLEEKKEVLFTEYVKRLQRFYEQMKKLKHLRVYVQQKEPGMEWDPSKIVISVTGTDITSTWLYEELLVEYKVQLELVSKEYVLAMTSICDTTAGFERLANALLEIDANIAKGNSLRESENVYDIPRLEQVYRVYDALQKEAERKKFDEAAGKICAEYIYLYPPGIPIVVPGERLHEELIQALHTYQELGLKLKGISDPSGNTVKIIKE